ncbi:LysR family transcriptional regulator [Actinotalea ferrariae]|uniref:LysR substrate-binding domain-containing protein n=1 Tax=Actinotalea ferrariae TaxID=1386098 RepID=UPI001C8BFC50|nr:LysR family transcriptional regulator [Actinotalea ferrariae]MBX9245348.1 LysR family transcriptional regulator [Actinotalea ferrariae]
MELELRHLRLVVAVAESGSVTKAAASMGLSQSALTAQLNRIDRTLGAQVFTRDRHGARATPLGELLLRHARVVLPAMDVLVDDTRRLVHHDTGTCHAVRVGTAGTAIAGLFVNRVHAALDDTAVTPMTSWSVEATAARLAAGTLDVALVGTCGGSPPPGDANLVWTEVRTDPVFVVVHDEHPFARRGSVPLEDLAEEVWLAAPGDGCFERCFVSACARAGFTPRGLGEQERAAAFDQVRGGHAVALVQPLQLDAPGVTALAIDGTPLRWTQLLGWREDAADRLDVGAVLDAALGAHEEAVRRSPAYDAWLTAGAVGGASTGWDARGGGHNAAV